MTSTFWSIKLENPDNLYVSMDANLWIDVDMPDQGIENLNILELIKSIGEEWIQQKTIIKLAFEKKRMKGSFVRKHLREMAEEKVLMRKEDNGNVFWKISDDYSLTLAR